MYKKLDLYAGGLAIFAMFFGAGNIIFPLALGQYAQDKTPIALFGLLITAVLVPFAGLLAMFLYQGHVLRFFSRLGRIPGFLMACLTIALLGPLGSAPRCIALAFSTMSVSVPNLPLILFSAISCAIIFLFAFRKNSLLTLLGYVLSPFKVFLLVLIIIKGFMDAPAAQPIAAYQTDQLSYFFHGLKEGYNTMDLLASFFFAPVILTSLAARTGKESLMKFTFKAALIGASLLSAVYVGFCYLAYLYAPQLQGIASDQMLASIAIKVLGPHAGLIVSLTVAIACLTTAIALIAAFASFVQGEVLKQKVGYVPILIGSLVLTFFITTLKFQGIAQFLGPVLEICYPVLIALTFYNLVSPFIYRKRSV
jgi:LIVCS family branched-chain amino acid:cation transporter